MKDIFTHLVKHVHGCYASDVIIIQNVLRDDPNTLVCKCAHRKCDQNDGWIIYSPVSVNHLRIPICRTSDFTTSIKFHNATRLSCKLLIFNHIIPRDVLSTIGDMYLRLLQRADAYTQDILNIL